MEENKFRLWLEASRPKTLAAAFVPVLTGATLAWQSATINWMNTTVALICAFLIQIGTNYANDYFDFIKGADTNARIGFRRATAAGMVTPQQMRNATILVMSLAFVLGLYLVWAAGWIILVIGLLSLLFGVLYTGGPFPLSYNGLGDIFVFIFFGITAVMTTYYINTLEWSEASFWASLAIGALCVNILVVNNLRDVEQDAISGKKTLGVLFGENTLKAEYALMVALAYAIPPHFYFVLNFSAWVFLPFLALPLAVYYSYNIITETNKANLNRMLELTAQFMVLFGVLFSAGIMLNG